MIWGMPHETFTFAHVVISLVAIVSGSSSCTACSTTGCLAAGTGSFS